jgi:hypothetical protein
MANFYTVVEQGELILARPQSGGKLTQFAHKFGPIYLTRINGLEENDWLFWRFFGKSPRLNQFGLS